MPNNGDLRVWWIPQVPMNAFFVPVKSEREAALIMHTLAAYDMFQYENNVKPDYSNAGGVEIYEEGEDRCEGGDWISWYKEADDDDLWDVDDFDKYAHHKLGIDLSFY